MNFLKSYLFILLPGLVLGLQVFAQKSNNEGSQAGIGSYSRPPSREIEVSDAFVRSSADGNTWTIGTSTIEMTYEAKGGLFKLISFRNKLNASQKEYISKNSAIAPFTAGPSDNKSWILKGADATQTSAGGQPVALLEMNLEHGNLIVRFRVIAYPGTSVIRQWIELENSGNSPMTAEAVPLAIPINNDQTTPFTHYWMVGGNSHADQGIMYNSKVVPGYSKIIAGQATYDFIPWTAFQRDSKPADGWFVALEYLGNWSLSVNHRVRSKNHRWRWKCKRLDSICKNTWRTHHRFCPWQPFCRQGTRGLVC